MPKGIGYGEKARNIMGKTMSAMAKTPGHKGLGEMAKSLASHPGRAEIRAKRRRVNRRTAFV